MGKVFFTRHGQTIWNVENKICGATDIELTELGHRQAEELGRKLAEEQPGIDEILYSPTCSCGRDCQTYIGNDRDSDADGAEIEGAKLWTV